MNKKVICRCYENLVKGDNDRYQCKECGKLWTKVKYIRMRIN